jgi:hypothetical protein
MTPVNAADLRAEQRRYAQVLAWGARCATAVLLVSYTAYLAGLGTPRVPVPQVQRCWHLSHREFAAATGLPAGWGFLTELHHPDLLALAALCCLPLVSLVALASVLPLALRRRDWLFAAVIIALVTLVALAA